MTHCYRKRNLFWLSIMNPVMIISYCIISVWIVVTNILTLVLYAKFRDLQNKTNALIISLSAVDLFTGLTPFLPKVVARLVGADKSFDICMVASVLQVVPLWASILHLVAIAIEHRIAITKPLQYYSIVTSRRLALVIAGNVFAANVLAMISLAWPRHQFQQACLSILWYPTAYSVAFVPVPMALALLFILFLYIHIFTIARKHERAIANICLGQGLHSNICSDSRATRVFILICGIALTCYVPFWI